MVLFADNRASGDWSASIQPYATALCAADVASTVSDEVTAAGTAALSPEKKDLEDEEEDLCNAQFSLAYGTRVLLHQTPFRVKIGRKYGLVGPNGAGKSTLMKSIAGGNLAGFPEHLVTVYVECEIIGEKPIFHALTTLWRMLRSRLVALRKMMSVKCLPKWVSVSTELPLPSKLLPLHYPVDGE